MTTAKGTESHKIDSELLAEIKAVADREDRTLRAQLERFVRAGMQALKKG